MTLKIVVLSDLHIVPEGQLSQGLATTERLRAGIAAINARHADADFVAIAGDLADFGDRASYLRLRETLSAPIGAVSMMVVADMVFPSERRGLHSIY